MDKEQIRKAVSSPGVIRGIYNYCDRWCERCTLSARCAVFATEQASPSPCPDNEAFWQQLHDSLDVAMKLLEEAADEYGVDLDSFVSEEDAHAEDIETLVRNHALVRQATKYVCLVDEWQDSSTEWGDGDCRETELSECEEVILRYHTLIVAKISRAVRQLFECEQPYPADLIYDMDGSAKVALIALDRSIAAWWRMRGQSPGHDTKRSILKCLVLLTHLKDATEQVFVNARDFVRPGFDEG